MAEWIWRFGEFETYHNKLVHSRRQAYGYLQPTMWKLYSPEPVVRFRKTVTTEGGKINISALGMFTTFVGAPGGESTEYEGNTEINLDAGTWEILVRVQNFDTFPALYIDGAVETDSSWECDDVTADWQRADSHPWFSSADKTPDVFPFSYKKIAYKSKEKVSGGMLFDFGEETFAAVYISNLSADRVKVQLGESREEALDPEWSVIHFEKAPENGKLSFIPYAFRYIFVSDENAGISAEYEYLPLERRGSFTCNNPTINKVWELAARTLHFNCREFFLDGIKRDRWVWSADAYQTIFVNHYLFLDRDIERRTLIALGGRLPVKGHINTIMDYTFFWFIYAYEYYLTYGDSDTLGQLYPQLKAYMDFCLGRVSDDGFMREKPGDWIFIDWADMDRTGALCGEQILFAKALECWSEICRVLGRDDCGSSDRAEKLRENILERFYDREKKVFIDSYESGKRNVTRHSNILAYLFMDLSDEIKNDIFERVILNPEVKQITTPYFKFYENQVYCMHGDGSLLEDSLLNYYGAMIDTGATSLYEEFDPTMKGAEHYAMYGKPYDKSLCHAWSSSPLYLLGAYRLGVVNTGVAYSAFEVKPKLGSLESFSGRVPLPDGGYVDVSLDSEKLRVYSTAPGGTLIWKDERTELPAGERLEINLK